MLPTAAQRMMDAQTPKINPLLGNGLAVEHMKHIESYLDAVFQSVASGFPPGLRYLGWRRCDPMKEFAEATRAKANRRTYDVARSDLYMVEYRFQYNDEPPITRYMYLPFVGTAGTIFISGSRFVVSPVLADRVISVTEDAIFIRVLKAKLTFNRTSYQYRANQHVENVQVVWSRIHNNKTANQSVRPTVKANHTLVHYLLCKYGFSEMFRKFLGFQPIVGGEELEDPDRYPEKDWVVCKAIERKGKFRGLRAVYQLPSNIRVAVPVKKYTEDVKNLLAGFFYIVDHFPTRVRPEFVDDCRLWMVLLGHIIWSGNYSEGKLYSDVMDHIASVDYYVDNITARQLKEIGLPCADIYELFYRIIENFNAWLLTSADKVNTMYDKELSVLTFVCGDYTNGINNFYFKLNASAKKDLSSRRIVDLMNMYLKQGVAYRLNRSHGEISTTSTSGDNKALKITNIVVPQTKSSKRASATQTSLNDPSLRLHASIAEVGGYACMPKSGPDGRNRLNLTLQIDPSGLVMQDPELRSMMSSVQEKIRRR